jgi:glycerate 2-kinase
MREPRALLRAMFDAAVAAAQPATCLPPFLPQPPKGRTVVVGAGKASAAMAKAVEENWPGALSGIVVTRYGHAVPCRRIEIVQAAHPVPDEAGRRAAARILEAVKGLGPDDLVLALISGGASALLVAPAPGMSLEAKQALNRALLRSGASISEMNCVRKHLSQVKGGRLAAAAAPGRVLALLISDVPGDDPSVIGSGPTVPDATTVADARAVLAKYGIEAPAALTETPKTLANSETVMIATPQKSLEAAASIARANGVAPLLLGDAIEGEAREVAKVMAGIARSCAAHGTPVRPPCVLLSGGETTVTVRGKGRGGRNAEFLLALAIALEGHPRIHALAADTDGIDGSEDNAGALIGPDTLARAPQAKALLAENDAYSCFAALSDLVVTGPTLTNVNDFRAILVT